MTALLKFARGDRPGDPDPFTLSKPLEGVRLVLVDGVPVGAVGRDARHRCWIVRVGYSPVMTPDGWMVRCGAPAVIPGDDCQARWEALHVFAQRLAAATLCACGLPVDARSARQLFNETFGTGS